MVYEKKRKEMIHRLRGLGIRDQAVLAAMGKVPRHQFVPEAFAFQAYDEKALPIGFEQTISHPFTVARMSEELEVRQGHKILEIGTGSGYQCAVLCMMGAQVFTIEVIRDLAEQAREQLQNLQLNFALFVGNGAYGWEKYAPYDAIIVTAGAPVVPKRLLEQLKIGGRLLIPVGDKNKQRMELYTVTETEIQRQDLGEFQFVPLTGKREKDNLA
jgi:protein-L-isoaspartate(D-aspartate) O-methyltransferase